MTATADAQLCALRSAQRIYDYEFARCARSPEWKAGALRALRQRAGLQPAPSPYASGTAQDDAWAAGNQAGWQEWAFRSARNQLPGQSGWEGGGA